MRAQDLSEAWPTLRQWERDRILAEVRGVYLYTRSAAERALARCQDKSLISDAVFETLWWIGAADGYLFTVFESAWKGYKSEQEWGDLLNGLLWARHQTQHDPLSVVPVTGHQLYPPGKPWHWAERQQIPISRPSRENEQLGEAYDRVLAGRVIIDTLTEATRVLRFEIHPNHIADRM